jgi:arylsulfatase A-like enzyme
MSKITPTNVLLLLLSFFCCAACDRESLEQTDRFLLHSSLGSTNGPLVRTARAIAGGGSYLLSVALTEQNPIEWRTSVPDADSFLEFSYLPLKKDIEGKESLPTLHIEFRRNGKTVNLVSYDLGALLESNSLIIPLKVNLDALGAGDTRIVFLLKSTPSTKDTVVHLSEPKIYFKKATAKPNVFVFCIDTWRWDYFDGFLDRGLTTNISEFSNDAVTFSKAYANSPWTVPSVASVLTGTLATVHGAGKRIKLDADPKKTTLEQVRDNTNLNVFRYKNEYYFTPSQIKAHTSTIPSFLNSEYTTYAWNTNYYIQNLDLLREFSVYAHILPPPQVNFGVYPVFSEWLDVHSDKLLFQYIHLMEPHQWSDVDPELKRFSLAHSERTRSVYADLVIKADTHFGMFIKDLKSRGLYDDALIILFSDHGEHLYEGPEKKYLGHGSTVFDNLIHVPLIAKFPANEHAGTTSENTVILADIFNTVLQWAQVDMPERDPEYGRSLANQIRPNKTGVRSVVSEYLLYDADLVSIKRQGYKAIFDTDNDDFFFIGPDEEIKNELGTIESADPTIKEQLMKELRNYLSWRDAQMGESEAVPLDDYAIEQLKKLGYIQ